MRFRLLFVVLVLAAVQLEAGVPRHIGEDSWRKVVAKRGVDPDEAVFPFSVTPEMKRWAEDNVGKYATYGSTGQLHALQEALFREEQFRFEYDENLTLTAAEAFTLRRGNCMSFTALFIALSRSLGISTNLVSVRRSPEIERDNGLVVVNRHVVAGHRSSDRLLIFDFYVTSAAPYIHQRVLDDVMASAMYHTNLGGEAIRAGDLNEAIWHLEISTDLAPDWAPGWINLGVARARLGDRDGALESYREALEAEPDNSSALTNMALLYRSMGRREEAERVLEAAAQNTSNPFTLIAIADVEMIRGDFAAARRHLRKARWWYRDEPEIYEALSRLAEHEGDPKRAGRYAVRAEKIRMEDQNSSD